MNSTLPAGWYPDNTNDQQLRYWDGHQWTEHTAPLGATPPAAAPAPATAATDPATTVVDQRNWFLRHKVLTGVAAVLVLLVIIGAVSGGGTTTTDTTPAAAGTTPTPSGASKAAEPTGAPDEQPAENEDAEPAAETTSATPEPEPAPAPEATVEDEFLALVAAGHDATEDAGNEIAVVQARKARSAGICKLLPGLAVSGWTGEVEDISTTMGGDGGVLSIALDDDTAVQTWNNGFSDIGSGTLINENSPLYAKLATLSDGDQVAFSGRFVRDADNCVQEQSLMDENGMLTPDFSFKFTQITKQ